MSSSRAKTVARTASGFDPHLILCRAVSGWTAPAAPAAATGPRASSAARRARTSASSFSTSSNPIWRSSAMASTVFSMAWR